jgi:4-diphosphocytidyl-2-C-methyl-D-erythritol kinase
MNGRIGPDAWVARAPAKVNLGLFVGPVRCDGRHELVSVMQSISLSDELTLTLAPAATTDEVLCPGIAEENLASRALALFREATGWSEVPLRISIAKRVPVAAGMGGGSGDAAAALRLAHAASGLGDHDLLLELARELGADVPAQIAPGRWLATGAGELLEELPDPDEPLTLMVMPSLAELSTPQVYAQADRLSQPRSSATLQQCARELRAQLQDGSALPEDRGLLRNDLELAAIDLCPPIEATLAQVRQAGADRAMVSGSGPTVVGLFAGPDGAVRAQAAMRTLAECTPSPVLATAVDASFARPHRQSIRNNAGFEDP